MYDTKESRCIFRISSSPAPARSRSTPEGTLVNQRHLSAAQLTPVLGTLAMLRQLTIEFVDLYRVHDYLSIVGG